LTPAIVKVDELVANFTEMPRIISDTFDNMAWLEEDSAALNENIEYIYDEHNELMFRSPLTNEANSVQPAFTERLGPVNEEDTATYAMK